MTAPVVDDPVAYCLAEQLRECLCTELDAVSAPVNCCCHLPGQVVVWDSCDPGQAWVRVVRVYMAGGRFPAAATPTDLGACGGQGGWAVTLELGVLRCMPQPDERGNLPSCEDYSAVARLVDADAHAMRRAVLCCDWRGTCLQGDGQMAVGEWLPLGPQGTCVGGTMTVTVEVRACICDPTPPQ